MSTTTLAGNTLCGSLGIGSFTNIGTSLSKAKQTTSNLANELNSLKNKIDAACTATNMDTIKQQISNAKNREETKKSSFFCCLADTVATMITGKDIYTLLKEKWSSNFSRNVWWSTMGNNNSRYCFELYTTVHTNS